MRKILFPIVFFTLLAGCGKNSTSATDSPTQNATVPVTDPSPAGTPVLTETKDATGKVLSSGYMLEGKKESSWLEYYGTGVIKTLTTYYHDKKEGVAIEFTNNGSV